MGQRTTGTMMETTSGATRRQAVAGLATAGMLAAAPGLGRAQATRRLHILVPAAIGGGWDETARAVAEGLTQSLIVDNVTLEHVSGGGGARAIDYLVATGDRQHGTLMVSSAPIVLRAVRGATPSYQALVPIAALVGDYAALAVRRDSPHQGLASVAAAIRSNPAGLRIAGGSVKGGIDHLVIARTFITASEVDPKRLIYFPYDADGGAIEALLTGQVNLLSTGLGQLLASPHRDDFRILAVTAAERVPEAPDVPTLRELGHDVTFVNWRGFFGPPQVPPSVADAHAERLGRLLLTAEWQAIRQRHAWQTLFRPRGEFAAFLQGEEAAARSTLEALELV